MGRWIKKRAYYPLSFLCTFPLFESFRRIGLKARIRYDDYIIDISFIIVFCSIRSADVVSLVSSSEIVEIIHHSKIEIGCRSTAR